MIARVMPRLDRVMRDVEVFADKIARHPESLGLGGVVSPSAGLKEGSSSSGYFPKGPGHSIIRLTSTDEWLGSSAEASSPLDGGRGLLTFHFPVQFVVTWLDVRGQFRLGVVAFGDALGVGLWRRRRASRT